MSSSNFKFTYATMFNPPAEMHTSFDQALIKVKADLGKEYGMIINGKEHFTAEKFESCSPINTEITLGIFQKGNSQDAEKCLQAARQAYPSWSHTPWQKRIELLRKAADLIDERTFEIAAVLCMEVGKNRNEALGDVAESAALIRYACDQMEQNDGYVKTMGSDPIPGYQYTNISSLVPYGVWLIVSPFNFPAALTYGPAGAALAAGNTVVIKPATDTPFTVRLIAECLRDAGLPDGVFNFGTGPGRSYGQALIDSPEVDGVTFTGSFDVGMGIFRDFANKGKFVRPTILELGGKNPAIVSRNADVERAALGIVRSAFGLQGQKCSACSRVYVEEALYERLVARVAALTNELVIGDPTEQKTYIGPVINKSSFNDFQTFTEDLSGAGNIVSGGKILTTGDFSKGYFCMPTVAVDVPYDHYLWQQEMFLPITMIGKVKSLNEAMQYANAVNYGLTSGFYGNKEETAWFFEHIEAGVNYANRPQGATTGAWPGFQPFGGWKGSGSSGKNAGGHYYLPLYMHEKVYTTVE
ncbi:MAG: aldehyde dehydrogenase family protein [Chloroflexota bacterium]